MCVPNVPFLYHLLSGGIGSHSFCAYRSLNDTSSMKYEPWVYDGYATAQLSLLSLAFFPSKEESTCLLFQVAIRSDGT